MDKDRLECMKVYRKRLENVPYPPPPLASIQEAFLDNYFEVKPSTIKGAGLGLFVRTHRKDTGEPIVSVGPFTLFYEGTLRSKREDTDLSDYWRPRQGKYIEPDTTAMTYRINDCPLVNTPHAPLTNLVAVENHTGELRAEEPIAAGEELFVSYGPDYNWFSAWMTLTRKLYTELQELSKMEKGWHMQLTEEGFHMIEKAIKKWKLRSSVDRASLRTAGWGPAGEVHKDWEQWVDEFLLLWSVVTARYEPPATADARKRFPHCLLGVPRFAAHFTFGLAEHTSYEEYNRDDFKEVFQVMFRDRARYKKLKVCRSYTEGPYIAQQKAMTAKRGESVMYIDWGETWKESDFKDRVRLEKRQLEKQQQEKPKEPAPKDSSSESGTDDDYKRPPPVKQQRTMPSATAPPVTGKNLGGYVYNSFSALADDGQPVAGLTTGLVRAEELEAWEPVVRKSTRVKQTAREKEMEKQRGEQRRVLNQLLGAAMSEGQDLEVQRLLHLIDRFNDQEEVGEKIVREAEDFQLSQVISSEDSDLDSVTVMEAPPARQEVKRVGAAEKTAALKKAIMSAPVTRAATAVTAPAPPVATLGEEHWPLVTPSKPAAPESVRSPSMTPARSYSQAVTVGGRSAKAQQAYVHSDKYYIRNTEVRYDFNLAAYEKGKKKSTLVQSERNIRVFNRTEDWPIEDWWLEWFTHAKSKNEHPHDLAMFLFGRSGFSAALAQECLVSQQVGTSLTTAWQPAAQEDLEDCWRWVEALVTFFFVKYRTMYTQQQVMARMMSLRLTTPDFEGLLALWAAVLRWYKRLDREGMMATDLVQIMIQAIQESPARPDLGLFGSLNVNAFTSAYNAELQLDENSEVEPVDLIQKVVHALHREWRNRPPRMTTHAPAPQAPPPQQGRTQGGMPQGNMQRPVRTNQAVTQEGYSWDGQESQDYRLMNTEEAPTYSNMATAAPQGYHTQQRGNFQGRPQGPHNGGGNMNSGGQAGGQGGQQPPPVQEFDLEEGETLLTRGDRCFTCAGRGHYAQNCPYRDNLNRLCAKKLAQLAVRKGDCIVERSIKFGSLSRRNTQSQESFVFELRQARATGGSL